MSAHAAAGVGAHRLHLRAAFSERLGDASELVRVHVDHALLEWLEAVALLVLVGDQPPDTG